MTAESIIVAFLVVYGATIGETLVSWKKSGEPIFGTVFAGLLISALAITAFQSIYLLSKSIDITISDLKGLRYSDERYRAGYDLFLMVTVGSAFYVMINAFSILHYAVKGHNVRLDNEPLCISIAASFFIAWALFAVLRPLKLIEYVRYTRSKAFSISKQSGDIILGLVVVSLIGGVIMVECMVLPLSLGWPAEHWSILFLVVTFVCILIASVHWERDTK